MSAEKTREFLRYYCPYTNGHTAEEKIQDNEKDDVMKELSELENFASKQTPLKPIILTSEKDEKVGNIVFAKGVRIYKCQCGKFINFKDNYCRNCGQKQDWD